MNEPLQPDQTPPEPPAPEYVMPKRWRVFWLVIALLLVAAISAYLMRIEDRPLPATDSNRASFEPDAWRTAQAKAPTPRTEVTAALFGSKAYVIGGLTADDKPSNAVELFDLTTEQWSQGPSLPATAHHTTALVFDNKLYVIGGFAARSTSNPTDAVYVFDGQSWQAGVSLPEPIGAHAAAVLNGRIYVVGGVVKGSHHRSTPKMYSLGTTEKTWREEPAMTVPRNHLTAGVIGNKLYAVGGRNDTSMTLTVAEVYDPLTKVWSQAADLPTGRSGIAAAVLHDKLYVFGGESSQKTFDEAEVFDPLTDKWQSLEPMPASRHGLGAVTRGNSIYLFLGGPQPGLTVSDNVQILKFKNRAL
jgi:N-acetylneuraminic acid mutarotase